MIFGLMREFNNLLEVDLDSGMVIDYKLPNLMNPNIASIQFLGL